MMAASRAGLLVFVGLLGITEIRAQDTVKREPIPLLDTLAIKEEKEPTRVIFERFSPLNSGYGGGHAQPGTLYVIDTAGLNKRPTFFRKVRSFIKGIFNSSPAERGF